uniref:Uncharacterized protein n=1 Tax=Corethron hystrix TaxID=216773 RepID=A0A7S1G1Q9_9STRA|mmetsp:Transcript_6731/g.14510  ORF Transcript_6731/g.14510 Transcript_6731/m.14510 type:complete len:659 (+) Transcript_6731:157-2133(+)|eukprot:CAMPEP_0113319830 /NCGR_PEP_ID=MMETSP0010_2-20120614/13874_1 /TAXON_ID=216773 ORGANISM="Corethron hystrix, Strain 308" /NCGR_SAMPLE_ID=MMETSP0010_2 /ASSEMBLY_ACC=CAM_ASM_000155 /LENGTH=658 /DNA_ID=CAMNT_0000177475 /DNA_START=90 /DNA_END=2066 /DNA_ORIENTATION=- /assembly_acc=CAM_ASM_000155
MRLGIVLYTVFWKAPEAYCATGIFREGIAKNRNQTPVMGRGYSAATSQMLSSCMIVPDLTNPTFDYDYKYQEVSKTFSGYGLEVPYGHGNSLFDDFKNFVGVGDGDGLFDCPVMDKIFNAMRRETDNLISGNIFADQRAQFVFTVMKADLYYNSADESSMSLSADAVGLLRRGEFIGFIQACGPAFIRSIRRTKQIGTLFTMKTSSTQSSSYFSSWFWFRRGGQSTASSSNTNSLNIEIFGVGLYFNAADSTLVAKSMDDYDAVMAYGFESMKDQRTGLVESIEILPWASSTSFQVAAKLDFTLEQDDCSELTERTCNGKKCKVGTGDTDDRDCMAVCYVQNSDTALDCSNGYTCTPDNCYRVLGSQKETGFAYVPVNAEDCFLTTQRNKFATNEESFVENDDAVYTPTTELLCNSEPDKTYLIGKTTFSPQIKIFNFMSNAEFIANVDAIVRNKFDSLELLSQCTGLMHSYSETKLSRKYVLNTLNPLPMENYDQVARNNQNTGLAILPTDFTYPLTALRLKDIITGDRCAGRPANDCLNPTCTTGPCHNRAVRFLYGRKVTEFNSFINVFYGQCLLKLSEESLELDSGKIFTHHWLSITECNKPLCLLRGSTINGTDCALSSDMQASIDSTVYDPKTEQDYEFLVQSFCMPEFFEV